MIEHDCVQFQFHRSLSDYQGLSIRKETIDGKDQYFFRFQVADQGIVPEITSNATITLTAEVGISFCPWCGQKLD
jgi:hypothetical protein